MFENVTVMMESLINQDGMSYGYKYTVIGLPAKEVLAVHTGLLNYMSQPDRNVWNQVRTGTLVVTDIATMKEVVKCYKAAGYKSATTIRSRAIAEWRKR
jgi:hypothetical protein